MYVTRILKVDDRKSGSGKCRLTQHLQDPPLQPPESYHQGTSGLGLRKWHTVFLRSHLVLASRKQVEIKSQWKHLRCAESLAPNYTD